MISNDASCLSVHLPKFYLARSGSNNKNPTGVRTKNECVFPCFRTVDQAIDRGTAIDLQDVSTRYTSRCNTIYMTVTCSDVVNDR